MHFMFLSPALMSAFGFAEPHIRGRGAARFTAP
jgi:hypothetical protein